MFTVILVIHIIIALLLVAIVLSQSGRSSGLVESFSFAESILGTKTPKFFTKLTAVLAALFIVNCIALSFLTYQRSKSLIGNKATTPIKKEQKIEEPAKETTQETTQETLPTE